MTGRRLRVAAGVLAVTLLVHASALAGIENAGTTAANFLSLGAGTRTLAMGGATLGLGDEAASAGWNAAALGWVEGMEASLSHAGLPNSSLQEWGSLGGRFGRTQTRWAVTGLYQGDGTFEGRDATGAPTGDFSVSSMALGATVAQQLSGRVTLGAGAKAVREKIADVSGSGFVFDAGLMVRAGRFGLGVAAQNLGGHMAYGAARYPFPTSYGAGVAFTHPTAGVRVAVDANWPDAYHPDVRSGVEWTYRGVLALRAGYRKELGSQSDPLTGPSFGLGAHHAGTWLDYGYILGGDGPGQHRMGLRYRFGGSRGDEAATGAPSAKPAGAKPAKRAEKPNDFDWARDGGRLGPKKP